MQKNNDKYFLSHKFTGLDYNDINNDLSYIKNNLIPKDSEYFCSLWMQDFFKKNNMTDNDIYDYCLIKQENSDIFLAYIVDKNPSKWMQLELDKAIKLNQKIIVIIKENLAGYPVFADFIDYADKLIFFKENIIEIKTLD